MQSILLDQIRRFLPDVVSQIEHEKAAYDAELKALDPSRSSRDQQLRFWLDIQASFRSIVKGGMSAAVACAKTFSIDVISIRFCLLGAKLAVITRTLSQSCR